MESKEKGRVSIALSEYNRLYDIDKKVKEGMVVFSWGNGYTNSYFSYLDNNEALDRVSHSYESRLRDMSILVTDLKLQLDKRKFNLFRFLFRK